MPDSSPTTPHSPVPLPEAAEPGLLESAPETTRRKFGGKKKSPVGEVPPPPPPYVTEVNEKLGPFRDYFARMSLRNKLALILMLVLFSGLILAAVITASILRVNLIAQVDDDLYNTYSNIAQQILNDDNSESSLLPSDYYMALRDANTGKWREWVTPETTSEHGSPDLSAYIPKEYSHYSEERYQKPFTTTSLTSSTQWRVVVQELYYARQSEPVGYIYVALPLTDTWILIGQIQQILVLSAVAITILGGAIGIVAVGRSLIPLTRIEQTAARISEGDLTLRVPQTPIETEIGSLAHSLNSMLGQLELAFADRERSEQKMRQFVSDASHELRTPLATIRGYGELYRMGAIPDKQAMDDTMRRVEDSATRMASLVDDLLHLARLDEGRKMRSELIDLSVLAVDSASDLRALDPTRTVKIIRPSVPANNTNVYSSSSEPLGNSLPLSDQDSSATTEIVGDEDKIRQVFANLIGNIARHTPEGTPVEVALGTQLADSKQVVVVEFRDHGPGVPAEHIEKIFERFYRVDSSRNRKSGGSGLGLAIVSAIIHAHNGSINVYETEGGGLTFRLTFPVAQTQPDSSVGI